MGGILCTGGGTQARRVNVARKDMSKEDQLALKTVAREHQVSNKRLDQMAKSFQQADYDGNGTIEFKEFLHVFEISNGVLAKSLWKYYDQNGNSTIDFMEFVSGLADTLSVKSSDDKIEWAFDLYDLNGDGVLTLEEIAKCLKDKNVGIPWEVKHLKAIFSDRSVKKNAIERDEFCAVAKGCATLTFPAFVMLDTVKAKAFEMRNEARKPKDMGKDLERARKFKKNEL